MKRFIIVAGNIGAGKSTLVRLLCEQMDCRAFYEPEAENPYLPDFYRDMLAWGFHSQIFFLANRLKIHREVLNCADSVIQDRSIYEDAEMGSRVFVNDRTVAKIVLGYRENRRSS